MGAGTLTACRRRPDRPASCEETPPGPSSGPGHLRPAGDSHQSCSRIFFRHHHHGLMTGVLSPSPQTFHHKEN